MTGITGWLWPLGVEERLWVEFLRRGAPVYMEDRDGHRGAGAAAARGKQRPGTGGSRFRQALPRAVPPTRRDDGQVVSILYGIMLQWGCLVG